VTTRLAALTARRKALQLECDLQRDEVRMLYGGLEARATRTDRLIHSVRSLAPAFALGGIILLLAIGPARALRFVRQGLTTALYTTQLLRWIR
jgi:hypothetical protein